MPSKIAVVLHRFANLFVLFLLTCSVASAHNFSVADIEIDHPWAMPLPPVSANGAVYMVIQNNGDVVDRLLGGTSTVAEKVEVHAHIHKDGQMTMQHLADGLEIAPGKTAKFVPGELHLMLIGLKKPLVEGENFPVTLEFEQAGSVDVIVNIERGQAGMKHGTSDNSEHMGHSAETKTVE